MKFSFAAVVAVMASVAYSQSVSDLVGQLPSCALTCLATASTAGGCGLTDYACQCGSARAGITKSATPCIATGCSADDATKTLTLTNEICAAAGSSGSSAASSTTSAAESSTSAAGSVGSSIQSVATSAAVSTTTSAASTTTSAPAQISGNAASKMEAGAAMIGAAVLAAFAL